MKKEKEKEMPVELFKNSKYERHLHELEAVFQPCHGWDSSGEPTELLVSGFVGNIVKLK